MAGTLLLLWAILFPCPIFADQEDTEPSNRSFEWASAHKNASGFSGMRFMRQNSSRVRSLIILVLKECITNDHYGQSAALGVSLTADGSVEYLVSDLNPSIGSCLDELNLEEEKFKLANSKALQYAVSFKVDAR